MHRRPLRFQCYREPRRELQNLKGQNFIHTVSRKMVLLKRERERERERVETLAGYLLKLFVGNIAL